MSDEWKKNFSDEWHKGESERMEYLKKFYIGQKVILPEGISRLGPRLVATMSRIGFVREIDQDDAGAELYVDFDGDTRWLGIDEVLIEEKPNHDDIAMLIRLFDVPFGL